MNTNTPIRQIQNRLFPQWQRAGALTTLIIIVLLVVGQGVVQYAIAKRSNDEQIINVSGRQGTLSQRISKIALLLVRNSDDSSNVTQQQAYLAELKLALQDWQIAYQTLTTDAGGLSDDNDSTINNLYEKQKLS